MSEEVINYEKDIVIDETALDVEWLEQPKLMVRYAKYCAECERDMDGAKEKLELVRSELDADIRANWETYGLEKVTDKAVEATIPKQEKYKKASKAYLDAKFEFKVAKGVADAFDARKTALENLVRLHGQQYFAGPSVPRNLEQEREKRQMSSNNTVGQAMKRKNH